MNVYNTDLSGMTEAQRAHHCNSVSWTLKIYLLLALIVLRAFSLSFNEIYLH